MRWVSPFVFCYHGYAINTSDVSSILKRFGDFYFGIVLSTCGRKLKATAQFDWWTSLLSVILNSTFKKLIAAIYRARVLINCFPIRSDLKMDDSEKRRMPDSLYLEVSTENKEHVLPLHSSITLFLLSYCESTSFRVILLSAKSGDQWTWVGDLSSTLAANPIQLPEPLGVVGACRLPAVLEADGMYCRAGLAVVLRHVIQRTSKDKPGHLNLTSLLGFKNTCLKACAEVRSLPLQFNLR